MLAALLAAPGFLSHIMSNIMKHICVCICTYKRPEFLRRLLRELAHQDTCGLFTYSMVVVDNDHRESAKSIVSEFAAASSVPVTYSVQPVQSIALTRNKALENTTGDFVAFIDDDEFPTKWWLLTLFKTCNQYGVDGVLGPVKPHFEEEPPRWVVQGKFYDRPTYPTGFVIDWKKGRTGNVLVKRQLVAAGGQAFNPQFLTGEDQDFFGRMIERGHVFIWCNEAVVYEAVPPIRWKRTFLLRRALLQGASATVHPSFGAMDIAKSVVAVSAYTAALPFAQLCGHHWFMTLLVKLFDHLGKLLTFVGIRPIKDQYVIE